MITQNPQPDFLIHASGYASVWQFEPLTDAARDFVGENVALEDWQKVGNTFAVDHRCARDLAHALAGEGFVLLNPAYGYFQQ